MITAKVFISGNSQAVRLPKEYRIDADEVSINRIGNILLLIPKGDPWGIFSQGIRGIGDDFPAAVKKLKHSRRARNEFLKTSSLISAKTPFLKYLPYRRFNFFYCGFTAVNKQYSLLKQRLHPLLDRLFPYLLRRGF